MKKKLLTLTLALCVCAVPLWAVVSGRSLTNTLKDLCSELQAAYRQRSDAQQRFNDDYKRQHQRMIDVVTGIVRGTGTWASPESSTCPPD